MADLFPTLARPPIVEGLLDIQVEPLDQDRLAVLESIQSRYPDYPHKADRLQFAGAVQVLPTPGTALTQSKIGYQISTADNSRVIQVRLDGVTVSILKPYTKFADLEAEGRQLWKYYSEALQPKRALRIALRYINRIQVPPNRDLKESFLTTPEIAPGLPQTLNGYLMRMILPDNKTASNAILTQVLEGGPDGQPSVIFDIDVFQMVDLRPDDSRIWEIVADLRDYKNRIFFGSITEQLRREFE